MNIPIAIQAKAEQLSLGMISTGGGYDFVSIEQPQRVPVEAEPPRFLLTGAQGGSPQALDATASVIVMMTDSWTRFVEIQFPTAEQAINAIADPAFRAAAIWLGLEKLEPERVEQVIEAYACFPDKVLRQSDARDLTYDQLSRQLIQATGAKL